MNKKNTYRILVVSVFVVLFGVGLFIGLQFSNGKNNDSTQNVIDVVNKNDKTEVQVYKEEPVKEKTYDIEVVYQDHYDLCNETISKKDMVYGITIENLKKDEKSKQNKNGIEYELIEESKERLVYTRTINQNCPNHFLVKIDNGDIIIYNIVTDSMKTEYKKLDITQELIRPELLEELNNGIRVDSKQDLNLLIEDIES